MLYDVRLYNNTICNPTQSCRTTTPPLNPVFSWVWGVYHLKPPSCLVVAITTYRQAEVLSMGFGREDAMSALELSGALLGELLYTALGSRRTFSFIYDCERTITSTTVRVHLRSLTHAHSLTLFGLSHTHTHSHRSIFLQLVFIVL